MDKRAYFFMLLFIATILYQGFVSFNPVLHFYFIQKVLFIGLSLLWFSLMIYFLLKEESDINKKSKVMNIYIIGVTLLYSVNLIYLLFLDLDFGRSIDITRSQQLAHLIDGINLEPFKMVKNYYIAYKNGNIALSHLSLNIFGNIILFAPMGVLLPTLFKKMRSIIGFTCVIISLIVLSELSQVYFQVGIGDIDDVILNFIGAILLFLLWKIPIIKRKWNQFLYRG